MNTEEQNSNLSKQIRESLDIIVNTIDEATLVLPHDQVRKMIMRLEEQDLFKILDELYEMAPEDLQEFAKEIDNDVAQNVEALREIILSVAENGLLPDRFNDHKIQELLSKQLEGNAALESLERLELVSEVLSLRYRLHELLLKHYRVKFPDAANIEFDDLQTSEQEDELEEEFKEARKDIQHVFDEYLIEFELGQTRNYELEEMIFLAKKVVKVSQIESRELPGGFMDQLQEMIDDYNQKKYKLNEVSVDSEDYFSFHQTKLMGVDYNYGYFTESASNTDFFQKFELNDKPVMVLLHGMARDWAFWRNMIQTLIPYYQIIVPDMNGYGDSEELVPLHTLDNYADYVIKFLQRLGVENYSLMGHSLGSFTTQHIVLDRDFTPYKTVMFSSAPFVDIPVITGFLKGLTRELTSKLVAGSMGATPLALQKILTSADKEMEADNYYQRVVDKASGRAIAEATRDILFDYHITENLKHADADCMIVAGSKDATIPAKYSRQFADYLTNSKYVELSHSGHDEIVNEFLKSHTEELLAYLEV